MSERKTILVLVAISDTLREVLARRHDLVFASKGLYDIQAAERSRVDGVITNGSTGLAREDIFALPNLSLISCTGAGYENVDLDAARERGIAVTNCSGVNGETVADHALCLMLALARDVFRRDAAIRAGRWEDARSPAGTLYGAVVGILGLGHIGGLVAKRASGFGTRILYHARQARSDVPWTFEPDLLTMASKCHFLVATCPGGMETRHLINAKILRALGPEGYIINVARGGVVDTDALVSALATEAIAGAALDVVEGEPAVPRQLLDGKNVILTPHMAGRSGISMQAQADLIERTLDCHFSRRALPSPVP